MDKMTKNAGWVKVSDGYATVGAASGWDYIAVRVGRKFRLTVAGRDAGDGPETLRDCKARAERLEALYADGAKPAAGSRDHDDPGFELADPAAAADCGPPEETEFTLADDAGEIPAVPPELTFEDVDATFTLTQAGWLFAREAVTTCRDSGVATADPPPLKKARKPRKPFEAVRVEMQVIARPAYADGPGRVGGCGFVALNGTKYNLTPLGAASRDGFRFLRIDPRNGDVVVHDVDTSSGRPECDCPDAEARRRAGTPHKLCKHAECLRLMRNGGAI